MSYDAPPPKPRGWKPPKPRPRIKCPACGKDVSNLKLHQAADHKCPANKESR